MLKNYKVKDSVFDVEPHEVFLDKLAHFREEELGISEKKLEVPLKEKISYFLFAIFLILAISLFSKIFYFQVIDGKKLFIAAENNKGSANIIVPERGIIYDKNLKKLVSNSPAFDLVCDRAYFSISSDQTIKETESIAGIFDLNVPELSSKIQSANSSQVLVAEDINHEKLLILETKINEIQGCSIRQNTSRNYLYGSIFSQVLGYTARINKEEYSDRTGYAINDYIGKTGLEKYYETYLRGKPGQSKIVKSATGTKTSGQILSEPEAGNNLVLNIDADLQKNVYNSLEKSIKNIGAKKGAAIAMNPKTGAVLALVSYPSYDNNLFSGGISSEEYSKIEKEESLFNRATQGQYPTGSTIKPFEAVAALQENIISPDKQINDIGYIEVPNQYDPSIIYRYEGVTPHGWVDMKKALAVSSNIYFYTVGGGYKDQAGLGSVKIKKWLELFGWGTKTGIDLPGEVPGLVPSQEYKKQLTGQPWSTGDTYNFSIGQSYLKVTPIQVATAYCAIANGGTLYKPQIVKEIINVKEFAPEVLASNFIDQENLQIVREGMRDGVAKSYGSSATLNDLPVDVASKTGTAEIGRDGYYNTWISAFAPYENPEIVLVVTIEQVQGLRAATLPVAHDVLGWYFGNKK